MRWLILLMLVGCAESVAIKPDTGTTAQKQEEPGSFSSHLPDWLK